MCNNWEFEYLQYIYSGVYDGIVLVLCCSKKVVISPQYNQLFNSLWLTGTIYMASEILINTGPGNGLLLDST